MLNTEIWWWPGKNTYYCDCPITLQSALKQCDKDCLSNIRCGLCAYSLSNHVKMKEPIVSSRNTYLRNTMRQERMSGLALMKIHYKTPADEAVEQFKLQTNFLCLICATSEPLFKAGNMSSTFPIIAAIIHALFIPPLKILYSPLSCWNSTSLIPRLLCVGGENSRNKLSRVALLIPPLLSWSEV